ncbi:hypothetical protein CBR64_06255 [Cellulosimicrobium cellulans]|uniref:Uncharacterized protein n=1 Tax=Cellulosimicrobium cellulans TaxID=1710 RepID=A0A1Y0HVH6_CELCE|nr:hypothetical protein [Cellulosimicrobium cellulans]ARU51153.1 hypothetical protein CBR64_06255 [Cellulosimicrobium cellulans]
MSTYSYWRSDQGNMQALSDELAAQASMARSREASLNRRLRSLEGDLSSRVEVLTRLVNALIELGEVREELALFTPARRARDAARALTRAVVTGEGDVSHLRRSPDLADVPGYWLVPAALAVAELPAGRLDADAAQEALLRDRRRAATYLVAVCTLVGQPGLVREWTPWVLDAPVLPAAGWGSADGAAAPAAAPIGKGEAPAEVLVTGAERALWLAAAAGSLGDDGVAVVRAALADRVALLDDDARARGRSLLLEAAPALPGGGTDWGTPDADAASGGARRRTAAPEALPLLRAWAAWSRAVVGGEIAVPTTTPGPLALDVPAGAPPGAESPARPETPGEALLRVVGSLVNEGAPVERDLLERAELLADRVGRAPEDDGPEWDASAGTLVDLLVEDARGSDPGRAALAAPLVVDDLRTASHARASELAATPAPSRVLRLAGRSVTVTPSEDGAASAATARSELLARPVDGVSWGVVGGVGAIAVATLVLGIAVAPAWFAVTVVAGVVAAWQWFSGEQRARDQRAAAQASAERFDAELAEARTAVAAEAERARTQREAVATVVDDLDDTLADLGAPTPA